LGVKFGDLEGGLDASLELLSERVVSLNLLLRPPFRGLGL